MPLIISSYKTPTPIFYTLTDIYNKKTKIVNDNGTAIADDNVALVNGGGLINANRFTLGRTEIESNINYSALMRQVLGLMHFTPDYSSSEATNMSST
ncbi:hypothetical protein AVEN_127-1 [Araneus ventricosus]|uniref:Uncharacterized protein n=1 Tax=Araneus ventricosus TaxID=182803 RepID=A0A4Y2D1W0_ARAVE|nr:hypothetical protein AVEN_127-1 [Araneus ventricosus]